MKLLSTWPDRAEQEPPIGDLADIEGAHHEDTTPPARSTWPESESAAALCANPPPTPTELVHGMLYECGTMMMSGPSKARKTYTLLDAAIAVSGGASWFNFKTSARPTLYVNLELQKFAIVERINAIARARRVKVPASLHLLNLRGEMVSMKTLRANLRREIEKTGAKLVVLDPMYKITSASGVEENSNDQQAAFLYDIETECNANGAAIMLAHHFSKGAQDGKAAIDRAAGAGANARWGDVVMTMTEHKEAHCMTVEFSLRNFAPIDAFVVRWEYPLWALDDSLDPASLKKRGGRAEEYSADDLLAALGDETLTSKEWQERSGWTDGSYNRKRIELLKAGKVTNVSGTYRRA